MRYQSEHARRVARLMVAIPTIIVLWPAIITPRSAEHLLRTVALITAVFLLGEWLLGRRTGFTVGPHGLTLHTVLGWRRLPWSAIDHFEWQTWRRPQTEWLWAITTEGKRVLIPTVQRPVGGGKVNNFFASSRVRARDGRLADALEVLEPALDAARRRAPRAKALAARA